MQNAMIKQYELNRQCIVSTKKTHSEDIYLYNQDQDQVSPEKQQKRSKAIKIKRKLFSYMLGVYKFLSVGHIYNIFDKMCINEETIKNPDNDESLLKTLFYMRTITKIQTAQDFVKLCLKSNGLVSNVPYLIQRFNSFGDSYFHKIADSLLNICSFFLSTSQSSSSSHQTTTEHSKLTQQSAIDSFISSIKGKPYFLKIFPDELIFSNQFIELLGGSIQSFTQQCVKYRIITQEFFTSENYKTLLEHNVNFMLSYLGFLKKKVSEQDMYKASQIKFTSSLRSKNQKKIKVLVNAFMPVPYIFCMLIEQVLSQELLLPKKKINMTRQKAQFEKILKKEKEEILSRLNPPLNRFKSQNKLDRCSYAPKPKRKRRKSQCDYDY